MVDTRDTWSAQCRGFVVSQPAAFETLTVLYDGGCPLCRREIAHVKGLADGRDDSRLCFVDISSGASADERFAAERATLLARFHLQRSDGSRLDGAAAFVAMWERLPGWRGWRVCRECSWCLSRPTAVFCTCGPLCRPWHAGWNRCSARTQLTMFRASRHTSSVNCVPTTRAKRGLSASTGGPRP